MGPEDEPVYAPDELLLGFPVESQVILFTKPVYLLALKTGKIIIIVNIRQFRAPGAYRVWKSKRAPVLKMQGKIALAYLLHQGSRVYLLKYQLYPGPFKVFLHYLIYPVPAGGAVLQGDLEDLAVFLKPAVFIAVIPAGAGQQELGHTRVIAYLGIVRVFPDASGEIAVYKTVSAEEQLLYKPFPVEQVSEGFADIAVVERRLAHIEDKAAVTLGGIGEDLALLYPAVFNFVEIRFLGPALGLGDNVIIQLALLEFLKSQIFVQDDLPGKPVEIIQAGAAPLVPGPVIFTARKGNGLLVLNIPGLQFIRPRAHLKLPVIILKIFFPGQLAHLFGRVNSHPAEIKKKAPVEFLGLDRNHGSALCHRSFKTAVPDHDRIRVLQVFAHAEFPGCHYVPGCNGGSVSPAGLGVYMEIEFALIGRGLPVIRQPGHIFHGLGVQAYKGLIYKAVQLAGGGKVGIGALGPERGRIRGPEEAEGSAFLCFGRTDGRKIFIGLPAGGIKIQRERRNG